MENKELLEKIRQCSPYSNWTRCSDGHYRDFKGNPNPPEDLSEKGLYDFRTNTYRPLYELAKELKIISETREKKHYVLKKNSAEISNEITRAIAKGYFAMRGIDLPHEIFDQIGFFHKDYIVGEETHLALTAKLKDISGEVKQTLIIIINKSSGEKIRKQLHGKNPGDRALCFGDLSAKRAYVFEGLEDAVCWYINDRKENVEPAAFYVSCGAGNLKCVSPFLARHEERIVICDNDKAGMEGANSITVPCKLMVPSTEQDANEAWQAGTFSIWKANLIEQAQSQAPAISDADIKKEAYSEFLSLLHTEFPVYKKDLFSDYLYLKRNKADTEWTRASDAIPVVRLSAKVLKRANEEYFSYMSPVDVEDMFVKLKMNLPGELLIEIPAWDGVPRIETICNQFEVLDYTAEEFYLTVKEWMAKVIAKIYRPITNQHCLILVSDKDGGGQGVGKSQVIEALTAGLKNYATATAFQYNQNDFERKIFDKVVNVLSEFDKIRYEDVPILKDIIDKPEFHFDQKYEKELRCVKNRCSFIASSNSVDFFKDDSGNRRYRFFKIMGNKFKKDEDGFLLSESNYPGDLFDPKKDENRMQIIAEAKHYYEQGNYEIPNELRKKLELATKKETPETLVKKVERVWFDLAYEYSLNKVRGARTSEDRDKWLWISEYKIISTFDADELLTMTCKHVGIKTNVNRISKILGDLNLRKRNVRYYNRTEVSRVFSFKAAGSQTETPGTEGDIVPESQVRQEELAFEDSPF
jgi:hypothetical protein